MVSLGSVTVWDTATGQRRWSKIRGSPDEGLLAKFSPDGNRVGKITMDGAITEYPIPSTSGSPINIAVGPDRNVWFTKAGKLGRVTRDLGIAGNLTSGVDRAGHAVRAAECAEISAGADETARTREKRV